jgi:hypothetical protein
VLYSLSSSSFVCLFIYSFVRLFIYHDLSLLRDIYAPTIPMAVTHSWAVLATCRKLIFYWSLGSSGLELPVVLGVGVSWESSSLTVLPINLFASSANLAPL